MQLGVSQNTIHHDIETLSTVDNVKGQGKDTRGRKRSTGRPKGTTKTRTAPTPDNAQRIAEAVLDDHKTLEQVAIDFDLPSVQHVKLAVAAEKARREPKADRADLSLSAQQKFDAAIQAYKHKLDRQFEQRVLDEIKKRLDEMILPSWKKQLAEARTIYYRRKGILKTKREFNLILSCLHPDGRLSVTDTRLGEAFRLFNSLEKFLLDETQSPTEIGKGLPSTMAEWDRMRAAATVARKAKRHGGNSVSSR